MDFEFVDRIIDFKEGKSAVGLKYVVHSDAQYFYKKKGQFFLKEMILTEAICQLNAWVTMHLHNFELRPLAALYKKINCYGTAPLGSLITLSTEIKLVDREKIMIAGQAKIGDELILELIDASGSFMHMENFANPQILKHRLKALCSPCDSDYYAQTLQEKGFNFNDKHAHDQNTRLDYDYYKIDSDASILYAVRLISLSEPFLAEHFPRNPVMPASLILQKYLSLGLEFINIFYSCQKVNFIGFSRVKVREFIRPGDAVLTEVALIKNEEFRYTLSFKSTVANQVVFQGTGLFEKN